MTENITAISCEVTLNGVSTKSDGSISLRLQTSREFDAVDTTALFQLNRMALDMVLTPLKSNAPPLAIGGEVGGKTQSQRQRDIFYCLFMAQKGAREIPDETIFDVYLRQKMEAHLEQLKTLLRAYDK